MNPGFLNGAPKSSASNDYMSDSAQARYFDLMYEDTASRYLRHLDDRTTTKANGSSIGALRGLMRMLLMTLTHS